MNGVWGGTNGNYLDGISITVNTSTNRVHVGHSLLVRRSPVLIINQDLLVMTWLVIFLLIVILKFSVDLFFGSLSSMEEMCLLCSKSCHFLLSVTLK